MSASHQNLLSPDTRHRPPKNQTQTISYPNPNDTFILTTSFITNMKSTLLTWSLSLVSLANAQKAPPAAAAASSASSSQSTRTPDPNLVGTWTTKSRKVFTGPGIYDPIKDKFIEPALPGISYSFTKDGFYEEVYYRAIENREYPHTPCCCFERGRGDVG